MPNKRRDHDECRKAVCLLCLGKTKEMRVINYRHRELIEEYFISGYDTSDDRLPCAVCGNCRTILREYDGGDFTHTIALFDHSLIGQDRHIATRSAPHCECVVCTMACASSSSNISHSSQGGSMVVTAPRRKPGPSKSVTVTASSGYPISCTPPSTSKPKAIHLCSFCLTILARGKPHNCTKGVRNDNLKNLATSGSPNAKEKVASSVIRDKIAASGGSRGFALATSTGRPIQVQVGRGRGILAPTKALFSCDNMSTIQNDMNLSSNQTLQLASHIRFATASRQSVEPHLKQAIVMKNHSLDPYFDVKSTEFLRSVKGQQTMINSPTVYCSDIEGLVQYVIQERKCMDTEMKIGIDGGGGFLKVCLNIMENSTSNSPGTSSPHRSSYQQGIASKRMKDTSVKKLIILAIVPDTDENYRNMLTLWIMLRLTTIDAIPNTVIATDLKLANIILGLMSHSSVYPCTWCDISKYRLSENGDLRTLGNIEHKFWTWHDEGSGVLGQAKAYGNCVHVPIVKGDPNTLVIDIIPPPELHLLMGTVNTMYTALLKRWPEGAVAWAKACHVEREAIHGGTFNGNSCRLLLSKVDILRSSCPVQHLAFVAAFHSFGHVVESCFGTELKDQCLLHITQFRSLYLDLNINVTPKVHAVFWHVMQFCQPRMAGLGRWSEQASETVHSDFKSVWARYKVEKGHPSYSNRLLRAVCEYNSRHV